MFGSLAFVIIIEDFYQFLSIVEKGLWNKAVTFKKTYSSYYVVSSQLLPMLISSLWNEAQSPWLTLKFIAKLPILLTLMIE